MRNGFPILLIVAFCISGATAGSAADVNLLKISQPVIQNRIAKSYGSLPLSFELNKGQVDKAVIFLSRGKDYTFFLTSTEAVLSLHGSDPVRLKSVGANPNPKITGLDELPGRSNYFIGSDRSKWRTNVPHYARVKVEDVYPGIDLVYYGNQRQLEYDWIVAPGADAGMIRFSVESKAKVRIDSQGNLVLDKSGELLLRKPFIYQNRDGARTEIAGNYALLDNRRIGIAVGKYDTALPLMIDPILSYSTYFGGSDTDAGWAIAVDPAGNTYVAGWTRSSNLPLENPFQESFAGGSYDVMVSKFNASGDALIYSTYLGGTDSDVGYGIAVDPSGNAYVTGETTSSNFPTEKPLQAGFGNVVDAFVLSITKKRIFLDMRRRIFPGIETGAIAILAQVVVGC
jgi:hypothetical protein